MVVSVADEVVARVLSAAPELSVALLFFRFGGESVAVFP
jgi:hypothetical protein